MLGTNLTGATAVEFGGVAGSIASVAADLIIATTPAGAAGDTIDVTITTPGGARSALRRPLRMRHGGTTPRTSWG